MKSSYKQRSMRSFTLIELLVSKTCQICVLPLYYLKKKNKKMPYYACEASASCPNGALHIFHRKMLHTAKPCFIRSTFTLIELLVVIAIIAILASMLLPALQQARSRAHATRCIANQKSLVQALSLYADASKDFFPAAYNKIANRDWGWCGILVRDRYIPAPPLNSYGGVVFCPTAQYLPPWTDGWINQYGVRSYGLSNGREEFGGVLGASGAYFIPRIKLLQGEYKKWVLGGDSLHPRDLYQSTQLSGMALTDTTSSRSVGPTDSSRALHMRHSNRANVFYADASVRSLAKNDITPETGTKYVRLAKNNH